MPICLPNMRTLEPVRTGLSFHEHLSDAYVHTALVFGFENDHDLVARVATLAYCNSIYLAAYHLPLAAECIELLNPSLMMEPLQLVMMSSSLVAQQPGADTWATIAAFFNSYCDAGKFRLENPDDAQPIRQLVAKAAYLGLASAELNAELYREVCAAIKASSLRSLHINTRLSFWMTQGGLPQCHPVLEISDFFYGENLVLRKLVRDAIAQHLPKNLDQPDPWSFALWMAPVWHEGMKIASMTPNAVEDIKAEVGTKAWASKGKVYDTYLPPVIAARNLDALPETVGAYLHAELPEELRPKPVQIENHMIMLILAVDFAFWGGLLSETPASRGGRKNEE